MARAIREALSDVAAAQALADGNMAASREIPLSQVAEFHVKRLRNLARGGTRAEFAAT